MLIRIFDTMIVVALFLQGFFAAFLLEGMRRLKRSGGYHQLIAMCTLNLWLVQTVVRLLKFTSVPPSEALVSSLDIFDMTAVPACAFVLFGITRTHRLNERTVLLHELPILVMLVAHIITLSPICYYIAVAYSVIYGTVIGLMTRREIRVYNQQITMLYSNLDNRTAYWCNETLAQFFIMLFVWAAFALLHLPLMDCIYYVVMIICWERILYHLLHHLQPSEEEVEEMKEMKAEENEEQGPYPFVRQLQRLMYEEKIYLNNSLTLNDLATRLDTNRSYLSAYLNTHLGLSFYDYINGFRIETAERMLRLSDESIETIADESGFNSAMNLRRLFARKHGCTPGEWRKRVREGLNAVDHQSD